MTKVRQDAWSHEDDLLLAETVLRHVREGSTQLNAFEEVGDKLNRTSAACGFRWNAEVRNKYIDAMELAKKQRKERKRALKKNNQQQQQDQKHVSKLDFLAPNSIDQTEETQTTNDLHDQEENVPLTMDTVIQFLRDFNRNYHMTHQSKSHIERVEQENQTLHEKVNELEKNLTSTEEQLATIQEDYQTFIQIMERARKMTVLDDQESTSAPAFRMDKNGNLEQLVQGLNQ